MTDQPDAGTEQDLRLPSPEELVISTAQLAISLAAESVSRREQLAGAQLAIDTADALLPLVGRLVPPEQLRQYRRAVAELQLAYAQAAGGEAREPAPPGHDTPPPPPQDPPPPRQSVKQPQRPKIWTPRGDV
jgi:hypothetical protein